MRSSNNTSVEHNKAAVSITSSLYDRRALDCTEDKPLVNSINHLTFLASSSQKVRDALAQDGGIERLVDILYECRGPQTEAEQCIMAWKWVLAFQSLVLIGTRGTEKMRRKVVEAGILPVVVTVLDNFLITRRMAWVADTPADPCQKASSRPPQPSAPATSASTLLPHASADPSSDSDIVINQNDEMADSQPGTNVFRRVRSMLDQAGQTILDAESELRKRNNSHSAEADETAGPRAKAATGLSEDYGRILKCLGALKFLRTLNVSDDVLGVGATLQAEYGELAGDPVFSHHLCATKDIANLLKLDPQWSSDLPFMKDYEENLNQSVPREFEDGVLIPKEDDVVWALQLLAFVSKYTKLRYRMANTYVVNGLSVRKDTGVRPHDPLFDNCDYFEYVDPKPPADPFALFPDFVNEPSATPGLENAMLQDDEPLGPPEEQDPAAMSVSSRLSDSTSHCDLLECYYDILNETEPLGEATRMEHLRMDISRNAHRELSALRLRNRQVYRSKLKAYAQRWNYDDSWAELETPARFSTCLDEDIKPIRRLNIFPLVEKFTVHQAFGKDINYWATVILRNYNRKDEYRGNRRQCAYFGCSKWEAVPRQFAKCRRCKRAKYCSKECQSKAWALHKYWCTPVGSSSQSSGDSSSSSLGRRSATYSATVGSSSEHHHVHRHHHRPVDQSAGGASPLSSRAGSQEGTLSQSSILGSSSQPSQQSQQSQGSQNAPNAPTFPQGGFFQ